MNVPVISKEVRDGAAAAVGVQVKLQLLRLFLTETKRQEQKLVALSCFRIYLLTVKVPVRIEQSFSFIDITGFESSSTNKLIVSFETKKLTLQSLQNDDVNGVDDLLFVILESLGNAFPGIPNGKLVSKMELNPTTRQTALFDRLTEVSKPFSPCGNLSGAYMFMADRSGIPFMDDVIWDIDTIYQSQDTRELALSDFEHHDMRNCIPIISALRHNQWFTTLNVSALKLIPEIVLEILDVLKFNNTIKELVANTAALKGEFVQKMTSSVTSNSNSALTSIDLSANLIEDRGLNYLCSSPSLMSKLTNLSLAGCGLTSRSVGKLFEVLASQKSTSLASLNLSDNNSCLRDEHPSFQKFLSNSNHLTSLKLSGTECCLDQLFPSLSKGCVQLLAHLDVSRNVFSSRRRDQTPSNSCFQFFSKSAALQTVNMSSSKITPDAIKQILQGLASNSHIRSLDLNLSGNNLGVKGALPIESFLPSVHNIASLDISDNGLEQALESVTATAMRTVGLKKLCLGKNFTVIRSKMMNKALIPLVELLQSETTTIECLMLDDMKMKSSTNIILNALGTNICLKELDISGNQMGDMGMRMLSKALQINTHLTTLYIDGNNTTPNGFAYLASSINMNYTLVKMPTPILDVSVAVRLNQEKTFQAFKDIETVLQRNRSPTLKSSVRNYRLQQCFLSGTAQQDLERLVIHLQDLVRYLRRFELTNDEMNQVNESTKLFKEAQSVSQVFMQLHKFSSSLESDTGAISVALSNRLQDTRGVIGQQLQCSLEQSFKSLQECYPVIFKTSALQEELTSYCAEQCHLPDDFLTKLDLDETRVNILNKLSELHLSLNTYMTIRLVEELMKRLDTDIQSLSQVWTKYQSLTEVKQNDDLVKSGADSSKDGVVARSGSIVREKSNNYPNLRKSIHGRMLRPQTHIDSIEDSRTNSSSGDASNPTKQPVPTAAVTAPETKKFTPRIVAAERDLESVARDGPRLDHKAAKDRPVRAKTTKSNCAFGVIARSLTSLTSEEDDADEVDEDYGSSDASVFSPIIEHNISLHEVVKNNNKNHSAKSSNNGSAPLLAATPAVSSVAPLTVPHSPISAVTTSPALIPPSPSLSPVQSPSVSTNTPSSVSNSTSSSAAVSSSSISNAPSNVKTSAKSTPVVHPVSSAAASDGASSAVKLKLGGVMSRFPPPVQTDRPGSLVLNRNGPRRAASFLDVKLSPVDGNKSPTAGGNNLSPSGEPNIQRSTSALRERFEKVAADKPSAGLVAEKIDEEGEEKKLEEKKELQTTS